jgi:peptidoglycan/LPS O-acetylase OafA/YrhL
LWGFAAGQLVGRRAARVIPAATGRAQPESATASVPRLSAGKRYAQLDGLRALAAVGVLLYHASEIGNTHWTATLFSRMNMGVTLFFAISGFVLLRPLLKAELSGEGASLSSYLIRRVARIVPAYWLCLIVVGIFRPRTVFGSDWWMYFLFFQVYFHAHVAGGLVVAWSLDTEIAFYLALPVLSKLLARLLRRRRGSTLAALAVVAGAAVSVVLYYSLRASYVAYWGWAGSLPCTLCLFAPGMLFAVWTIQPPAWRRADWLVKAPSQAWWCAAVIVAGVCVIMTRHAPAASVWPPYALVAGLVLFPAVFGSGTDLIARTLSGRVLTAVGTVSYGVYLWHRPVIVWLSKHASHETLFLIACGGAATLVVAAASYYGLERRVIAFAHRREPAGSDPPQRRPDQPPSGLGRSDLPVGVDV